MTGDWAALAACRSDGNPDAWFMGDLGGRPANARALTICLRQCPVRAACHAYYRTLPATSRVSVIAGGVVWDSRGRPVQKTGAAA